MYTCSLEKLYKVCNDIELSNSELRPQSCQMSQRKCFNMAVKLFVVGQVVCTFSNTPSPINMI